MLLGSRRDGNDLVSTPNSLWLLPVVEPVLPPSFAARESWSLKAHGWELPSVAVAAMSTGWLNDRTLQPDLTLVASFFDLVTDVNGVCELSVL